MVAQKSKRSKKQHEKIYSECRVKGMSQRKSYETAYQCSPATAGSKAHLVEKRPAVQAMIQRGMELVKDKDIKAVVSGLVDQAKGSKKTVFVGKDRHKVEDNQATIASREQFFKLAGVQGFGTTVNIDNRKVTVNVGADEAQHVTDAMSKLLSMKRELDTDETDSDSLITIDVESTTSDDESTPSYEDS